MLALIESAPSGERSGFTLAVYVHNRAAGEAIRTLFNTVARTQFLLGLLFLCAPSFWRPKTMERTEGREQHQKDQQQ